MNRIIVNLYISYKSSKTLFLIALGGITAFFLLFAVGGNIRYSGEGHSVTYVGLIQLLIIMYLIILAGYSTKESISLSIRTGSTRKAYFWGSILFYSGTSAFFSIVHTLLFALENILSKPLGFRQINNYSFIFKNLTPAGALLLTIYQFLIFLAVTAFVSMLSQAAARMGKYGWVVFMVLTFVFSLPGFIVVLFLWPAVSKAYGIMNLLNAAVILASFVISCLLIKNLDIK